MTAISRFIDRRLLRALPVALAALAVVPGRTLLAQTSATAAATATAATPTPSNDAQVTRHLEAQRRLLLSRRRRVEENLQNAQYDLLLTASPDEPATNAVQRRAHRAVARHRLTTPLGRQAARPPTPPAVNP
jgi:hypothetical protein